MVDWYDWHWRKSHVIENAAGAETGYHVRIHVHKGAGNDSGEDVYLNDSLCRNDFGDIRFTGSDGIVQLPYWMESKNDGIDALFWVKLNDNISNTSGTIYLYYNNPDAITTSNGENTFLFFDDFEGSVIDTEKWDVFSPDQFSLNDSWANCTGNSTSLPYLRSKNVMQTRDVAIEAKLDVLQASGNPMLSGWRTYFAPNTDGCYWYSEGSADRVVASNGSTSVQNGQTVSMTTGNVRSNVYITDGKIRWKTEGSRNFDDTFENPTNDTNRKLACFLTNTNYNVKCDFIFVRKYIENEPQHGDWGNATPKPQ